MSKGKHLTIEDRSYVDRSYVEDALRENYSLAEIAKRLEKYKYNSKVAQANYESTLKSSREGISMSESELNTIDEISCFERTLYNYFEQFFFHCKKYRLT